MKGKIIGIFIVMLFCTMMLFETNINVKGDNERTILTIDVIDFNQEIEILMKLARTPSISACIIKDDDIAWSKAYGYSDLSQKKSATTDNIYIVASISKSIAATAILQLYEQGYFDLDDDVNDFLPFDF